MNTGLFIDILKIDSTSGKEAGLSSFLSERLLVDGCKLEKFPVGDGTENLLFSWGDPQVVFCTHMDTVPPYIEPSVEADSSSSKDNKEVSATKVVGGFDFKFSGRGTCDAKGQIFAMYSACLELQRQGKTGFGLLLLSGEETGSFGAKSFREVYPGGKYVIVGEPTDNCMASACKGTKSFKVTFEGKSCHSGYPKDGQSAIMLFNDFVNVLRGIGFPEDEILGDTTWNIGKLSSDNPQNVLSDKLTCRVYFRTTFASDNLVSNLMRNICGENAVLKFGKAPCDGLTFQAGRIPVVAEWQKKMSVEAYGGDSPMKYLTLEGFETKPVSFGSDAPQLSNFENKILCGPGSILVAHRPEEHIYMSDLQKATDNYIRMFDILSARLEEDRR